MMISVLCAVGGILGFLGLAMAVYALIEVKALIKSTHRIEYVPITHEDIKDGFKELKKKNNNIEDEVFEHDDIDEME